MGLESMMRMCAADEQCIRRHWMFPLGIDDHIPLVHSFFFLMTEQSFISQVKDIIIITIFADTNYETGRCLTPKSHDGLQSNSRNFNRIMQQVCCSDINLVFLSQRRDFRPIWWIRWIGQYHPSINRKQLQSLVESYFFINSFCWIRLIRRELRKNSNVKINQKKTSIQFHLATFILLIAEILENTCNPQFTGPPTM